ncbi:hypothetical protein Glove_122g121 [Diversispora epigaea]|uniref:Helitron helicase-like domain-containing protein n=1 Tax=Diversispora epigaea TaxID=1348612 RepID=A0A397J1K6_9GLOM|nr:hypothetical protein Glove_122g121 [Diversispora epigaea]
MTNRIMRYGEGLRGSRQFWMARRYELSDIIKQLGSRGIIFFTFSSADLHWPELHKLMPGGNLAVSTDRQKNLIDNPHVTAWFFNKCFETFFNNVLKQHWNLKKWWYRFEWQHRGSVHVHGPDAPVPDRHPCQKESCVLHDNLQDYIDLINKLQQHTRCSPSYCICVNKKGEQTCKFGYPKDISDHTFVRDDRHGWRANVDLKQILSIYAALQYISKYASKSELRSAAFSEIYNQILKAPRWIRGTGSREDRTSPAYDIGHIGKSSLKITGTNTGRNITYQVSAGNLNWDRLAEFEDFSLFKLNLMYTFVNGYQKKCEKENIVQIWPHPSTVYRGSQWEEFCQIKVLLHVRHRNLEQLTENGNITWSILYDNFIEEINEDPNDVLGLAIDKEEEIEEEDPEEEIEDDQDEYRPD